MKKDERIFLKHILESIEKIENFTKDVSEEKFMQSEEKQAAVIRKFEIIGEAVKNIPESFRKKYVDVPWSEMARTRDKLIHGYFEVNIERVWVVVKEDLPELKEKIKKILKEGERK